jgi:hypothetical protein
MRHDKTGLFIERADDSGGHLRAAVPRLAVLEPRSSQPHCQGHAQLKLTDILS